MYVYQTGPVDVFVGMKSVDEVLTESYSVCSSYDHIPVLLMECSRAVALAKGSYWEGDIRSLHVFAVPFPDENCTRLGVIWKQSNNGTTFICSPVELPWLVGDLLCKD